MAVLKMFSWASLLCVFLGLAGCMSYHDPNDPETLAGQIKNSSSVTGQDQYALSQHQFTQAELDAIGSRWDTALVHSENVSRAGYTARVDILDNDTDLKQIRIRLFPSNKAQTAGDSFTVFKDMSQHIMAQVCGQTASDTVMLYDRPSADVVRSTPFYPYRIVAAGAYVKEYGFRCLYNN